MNKNTFIIGLLVAFLLGVAGCYSLTHNSVRVGAISTAGTTNTSAKYYSVTLSLATASGTTTSMLNGSGYDLTARATDVFCQGVGTSRTAYTGAGLANLTFTMATSSTNNTTSNVGDINTKYLANMNIGTSTVDSYNATSTEGVIQGTSRLWPNGTYLIISSNATNTASCSVGISAMSL